MVKYYHFKFGYNFDNKSFEEIISGAYHQEYFIQYDFTNNRGCIIAENDLYEVLVNVLPVLRMDLDCQITFLVSFENTPFSYKLLDKAESNFPNTISGLSYLYLSSLIHQEKEFTLEMDKLFSGVDYETIQTALTFIQCGLNATLASKLLYVHRNTFNYRLNSFIEKTNLDIRDFDNAQLLDLYIKQKQIIK